MTNDEREVLSIIEWFEREGRQDQFKSVTIQVRVAALIAKEYRRLKLIEAGVAS